MVKQASIVFAVLLVGCLRPPELKECIDFPPGQEGCGAPCDVYCATLVDRCNGGMFGLGDLKVITCKANCIEAGANNGDGGSLACRFEQLRRVGSDPDACKNAALEDSPTCDGCGEYCSLMLAECPTMFPAEEQCLDACAAISTTGPTLGNNLECRIAQARKGKDACAAASLTSDGTCGDPCDGYCDQVTANCAGDDELYLNRADCQSDCELLNSGGPFDDWQNDGDSVQCRTWHASAPAVLQSSTHCPHASLYNDKKCGSACGTYCSICSEEYQDKDACLESCQEDLESGRELFPAEEAHVQCR